MNFSTRLTNWVARHPLKEPPHHNPAWFTAQVMQRVKALQQPARASAFIRMQPWLSWPRLGLTAALATTTVVLLTASMQRTSGRLAEAVLRDAQVLDALDDTAVDPAVNGDAELLAQELQLHDALMLAEALPSDDQWIEQTMQLLDQLDQDVAEGSASNTSAPSTDDDLLNELQLFDGSELDVQS